MDPCLHTFQGETFAKSFTITDDDARLDIKANELFGLPFSKVFCSDPLEGGGAIYSMGFFLFREFSPLDIFIVES